MNAAKGSLAKLKTRLGELTVAADQQQQQQQAAAAAKQAEFSASQEPLSPRSQQADRDAKQDLLEVCNWSMC